MPIKTTMRLAFERLPESVLSTPLGRIIFASLKKGVGVRYDRKGWGSTKR